MKRYSIVEHCYDGELHTELTPDDNGDLVEYKDIPAGRDSLLAACQAAYRKHHMDDDSVGWNELSDMLLDALCNSMGSDGYHKWLDDVSR